MEPKGSEEQGSPWITVVNRAATTPDFRRELMATPEGALQEMGVEIPEGTRFIFHEIRPEELHVFLPPNDDRGGIAPSFHGHYTTAEPQPDHQPSAIRTRIRDISAIGPLLDEGRLVTAIVVKSKDGGSDDTGGPCGACH